MQPRIGLSWFGILALAALLYVIVRGLANPITRPFVIGVGLLVVLGVVLFGFVATVPVQSPSPPQSVIIGRQSTEMMRPSPVIVTPSPPQSLPKSSAGGGSKPPRATMAAALRQAIVQAWVASSSPPVAEKPEVGGQKSEVKPPSPPMVPEKPQPPAWVNAAPKMEDGCYKMSVRVGPFTTPLECERELPKALRGAAAEYTELALGREAAAVRLPDDFLQTLVKDRWTETRPMEIDGGSQDMVSLHALVVFNREMQQRIKTETQRLVIAKRMQGAAVVFGGVLGLLAVAWGGLRWATRRQETKRA